jgi:hypothetical protein
LLTSAFWIVYVALGYHGNNANTLLIVWKLATLKEEMGIVSMDCSEIGMKMMVLD